MSVVAKFTVTRHEINTYEGNFTQTTVYLQPRYESKIEEDKRFSKATPSGEMKLVVDNKEALAQLEVGKAFYVTFNPVPEGVTAYHS